MGLLDDAISGGSRGEKKAMQLLPCFAMLCHASESDRTRNVIVTLKSGEPPRRRPKWKKANNNGSVYPSRARGASLLECTPTSHVVLRNAFKRCLDSISVLDDTLGIHAGRGRKTIPAVFQAFPGQLFQPRSTLETESP